MCHSSTNLQEGLHKTLCLCDLLGLLAITALDILTKVDAIHSRENAILSKFSNLFQGLGKMPCKYEIKLKPDAKPWAL